MLNYIIKLFKQTPFYPHWLSIIKANYGNDKMILLLRGKVLEVGAGDGSRKNEILSKHKRVTSYTATDYSTWDGEFERFTKIANKYGKAGEAVSGFQKRIPLDKVCSTTKLPFLKDSFDAHISFEVLEHIDEPEKYFSEAARVVHKGGYIALSVPFLYRMHGGEPNHKMDYGRYANGFFYKIATDNNIKLVEIFHNTGAGTSVAQIINQYVIRKIIESNFLVKIVFLILSPFIFLFNNIFGGIVDFWPDIRFATRFHVVFKK